MSQATRFLKRKPKCAIHVVRYWLKLGNPAEPFPHFVFLLRPEAMVRCGTLVTICLVGEMLNACGVRMLLRMIGKEVLMLMGGNDMTRPHVQGPLQFKDEGDAPQRGRQREW